MKKVKAKISEKLRKGIPLATGSWHTVRLEVTDITLTVHTGLSLFNSMAKTLMFLRKKFRESHWEPRFITKVRKEISI